MKITALLALLASVSAAPISLGDDPVRTTANEFVEGGCADMIFFYARGSTQDGNMGESPGPKLASLLEAKYGADKVAVQGLDYKADLMENFTENGTDDAAIAALQAHLVGATSKCPTAKIVVAGYSQGAAVIHAAFKTLPAEALARVNAVVTFGDTQSKKNADKIPNYPAKHSLFICNKGDTICEEGKLEYDESHSDYDRRAAEAADFVFKMLAEA
ncbi:putative cutinase 1 [Beauveria bassiana]|nr:putative cutinase 1 [Beauveria bassiana]KAH8717435.1 putative cutinase 1 [Beauveria bassiana]